MFIGYAPWTADSDQAYDRRHVRRSVLDISEEDWRLPADRLHAECRNAEYRREITKNQDFAKNVEPGSFVVVPRPRLGRCWVGQTAGRFELVDNPPWAEEFVQTARAARPQDNVSDAGLIGDVVQTWSIEKWVERPFIQFPRWLSYAFLSRTTIGWLPDRPDGAETSVGVLRRIFEGTYRPDWTPTTDRSKVEERLLAWVSPNALEHLACELLQLEFPDVRWLHVGGAGDGGVDGVGFDHEDRLVSVLQCKWKTEEPPETIGRRLKSNGDPTRHNLRVHVVTLYYRKKTSSDDADVVVWDRADLARLLIKHRSATVFSSFLRVGT